jgi:uncharacterized protein YbjQ (UPF0145 family)
MQPEMVTTGLDLPGDRVVRNIGVVRGIVVRSRSIVGNFAGVLQTLFGGNITVYTNLCERARTESYRMDVRACRRQRRQRHCHDALRRQ